MRNHPVKQTPGTKGDATFEDSKEEIAGGVPAREIAKDPVGHLHGLTDAWPYAWPYGINAFRKYQIVIGEEEVEVSSKGGNKRGGFGWCSPIEVHVRSR